MTGKPMAKSSEAMAKKAKTFATITTKPSYFHSGVLGRGYEKAYMALKERYPILQKVIGLKL